MAITRNEANRLYSAWRYASAAWQLALHAPGNDGDDLPEELERQLCDAEHSALLAFLRHPASNLAELSRKLQVFRDSGACHISESSEITAALAKDAHQLAFRAPEERRHRLATAA